MEPGLLDAIGVATMGMNRMAQDHAGGCAVELAGGVARIDQGIVGQLERQKLVGLGAGDGIGHGTELTGIKARQISQKPAALGIDLQRIFAFWVEHRPITQPTVRGLGDAIALG